MKKRGLRNQKLLSSRKSKIVFSLIVLMFGVVIVLEVMDIVDQNELNSYTQKYYLGNVNINNISNAIVEHLNGCG